MIRFWTGKVRQKQLLRMPPVKNTCMSILFNAIETTHQPGPVFS